MSGPLAEQITTPSAMEKPDDLSKGKGQEGFRRIVCIICGRWGVFVEVFWQRE